MIELIGLLSTTLRCNELWIFPCGLLLKLIKGAALNRHLGLELTSCRTVSHFGSLLEDKFLRSQLGFLHIDPRSGCLWVRLKRIPGGGPVVYRRSLGTCHQAKLQIRTVGLAEDVTCFGTAIRLQGFVVFKLVHAVLGLSAIRHSHV